MAAVAAQTEPTATDRFACRPCAHAPSSASADNAAPRERGRRARAASSRQRPARGRRGARSPAREGCNYCCLLVCRAPGAGGVPRWPSAVRSKTAAQGLDADAGAGASVPLHGLKPRDASDAKLPCPLLDEGNAAPMPDAPAGLPPGDVALAVEACIDEFEGNQARRSSKCRPPHLAHASNAHVIVLGPLRAARFADAAYELSAALAWRCATDG